MSSDTTNSTPPRNLSGIQAQNNEPIISNGEAGYYSSPPSSPGPEDERPSFFFQQEKQLSLGVYFSADEGENNDVIAALKAGQRVIKETADLLMEYRPKTEQNTTFAATLHAQDREFTQWIYSGLGIDASRRLSIRSLPLYEKLAKYINLLQDLESYLPYTAPSKVGSLLRRLSTSGPHPHPSSDNHTPKMENPRLALLGTKIEKRFEELKEGVVALRNAEKKRKASWDIAQRTRKDLKINHDLCLPETRVDLLSAITSWVKSDSTEQGRVLCIIGDESSGKSAVAATLAVEWKKAGILEREIFLTKMRPESPPPRRRSSGEGKENGNGTHPSALSRALSKFRRNSSRPSVSRDLPSALLAGVLNSASSTKDRGVKVVLVDGLDHALEEEREKIVGTLKEILEKRLEIKIVLTARADSAEWIKALESSTQVVKQEIPVGPDPVNLNDMAVYVSSRLSLLLTIADQQRVIDAAEGNWSDLVRLCTQVEEYGNPERALDIVLYTELVRKHGNKAKVVVV